jgi:glycosyltransferase involved in cell wall biosynthesis
MLHWHSPENISETGIASFTELLTNPLTQQFQINLVPHDRLNLDTGLHLYNIGNFYEAHHNIWWNSILHPGIVVLHDVYLLNMFMKLFQRHGNLDQLIEIASMLYGENSEKFSSLHEIVKSGTADHRDARLFPFTELATFKALSVVTHSEYASTQVCKNGNIDFHKLHLPYRGSFIAEEELGRKIGKKVDSPINLVICGFLWHNRFVLETLELLTEHYSNNTFHLHLIGKLDDHSLRKEVLQYSERVTFHGFIADDEFDPLLRKMDLAINIRMPSVGESSLSLLRCWANGVPCVVKRTCSYAEISEDFVSFVEDGDETAGLLQILEQFSRDRRPFLSKAQAGLHRVQDLHNPERYASDLFRIVMDNPELRKSYRQGLEEKYAPEQLRKWKNLQ